MKQYFVYIVFLLNIPCAIFPCYANGIKTVEALRALKGIEALNTPAMERIQYMGKISTL
jgi:hypothetical protein